MEYDNNNKISYFDMWIWKLESILEDRPELLLELLLSSPSPSYKWIVIRIFE